MRDTVETKGFSSLPQNRFLALPDKKRTSVKGMVGICGLKVSTRCPQKTLWAFAQLNYRLTVPWFPHL